MRTPVKLVAFGGALAVAFGGALGVGAAVGNPIGGVEDGNDMDHDAMTGAMTGATTDSTDDRDSADHGADDGGAHGDARAGDHGGDHGGEAAAVPGGLMVSDRGYTLDLDQGSLPAGSGESLAFRILGGDGQPLISYEESHDKDMHLIAVRRDTTGFQHVHPELAPDGTWTVPVDLSAGSWRVFADFVPGQGEAAGETITLGADLDVAGDFQPASLPDPSTTAVVDDYAVTLEGELVPGEESELTLSVTQDGQPVTDLQPYLGAYGHLVALRDGDLAYLHVHPAGEPGDGDTEPGPDITFYATAPSTGDYRLFLDFQHEGTVHTAEFTAQVDGTLAGDTGTGGASVQTPEQTDEQTEQHDDDGHDH